MDGVRCLWSQKPQRTQRSAPGWIPVGTAAGGERGCGQPGRGLVLGSCFTSLLCFISTAFYAAPTAL